MDQTSWVEGYAWFGVMENLNGVNPVSACVVLVFDIQAMLSNIETNVCAGQCNDDTKWADQRAWAPIYRCLKHSRWRLKLHNNLN